MDSEKELAAAVVAHYAPLPIYQEVAAAHGAADIVIDTGGRGWIIECKLTLGLDVIGQAIRWKEQGVAIVSVAVPVPRSTNKTIWTAQRILKRWGIGLLYVDRATHPVDNAIAFTIREVFAPILSRRKRFTLRNRWEILQHCREEHKTFCPAGSQHGRWSAFKATLDRVRRLLKAAGPQTMSQIISQVETHYASNAVARRCLAQWLPDAKVCPGIVVLRDGDRVLYAHAPEPEQDDDDKAPLAKAKRRSNRRKTS